MDGVADTWDQEPRGNCNQLRMLKKPHPAPEVIWSFGGWSWSGGTNWRSYDTAATSTTKMDDKARQGLGGTFFRELSGGTTNGELVRAINRPGRGTRTAGRVRGGVPGGRPTPPVVGDGRGSHEPCLSDEHGEDDDESPAQDVLQYLRPVVGATGAVAGTGPVVGCGRGHGISLGRSAVGFPRHPTTMPTVAADAVEIRVTAVGGRRTGVGPSTGPAPGRPRRGHAAGGRLWGTPHRRAAAGAGNPVADPTPVIRGRRLLR